jgi:hypothetical protein
MTMPGERQATWFGCKVCMKRWIALYLPMPVKLATKIMRSAHCPECGADSTQAVLVTDPAEWDRQGGHA